MRQCPTTSANSTACSAHAASASESTRATSPRASTPEVSSAIAGVIATLKDLGATLVPVSVPDRAEAIQAALTITDTEAAWWHRPVYAEKKDEYGPALGKAIERGLAMDPMVLAGAYITQARFRGTISRLFGDIDMLISPIYPQVAIRYDQMDTALEDLDGLVGYTSPYNLAGVPAITFPCGIGSNGMPIGVQLIGPHVSEAALLKAAHAYQQATDWHTRRPTLS